MSRDRVYEDAFNLLCGRKLGAGIHRDVFECALDPTLVVKVEINDDRVRNFANVKEYENWTVWRDVEPIARWLAPCDRLSFDGRILLQKRVEPIKKSEAPTALPTFLTDVKYENYGWYDGRIVCIDYAFLVTDASAKKRSVKELWW